MAKTQWSSWSGNEFRPPPLERHRRLRPIATVRSWTNSRNLQRMSCELCSPRGLSNPHRSRSSLASMMAGACNTPAGNRNKARAARQPNTERAKERQRETAGVLIDPPVHVVELLADLLHVVFTSGQTSGEARGVGGGGAAFLSFTNEPS